MPQYTLTLLDTPGIQPYIFASNRLRESIGASELVRLATTVWPREVLRATCRCNVAGDDARIEDGDLDAEVIYVGGGNCLILFRELERARRFATALSRKLHEAAPDLEFLREIYVPLVRWNAWWFGMNDDDADGLAQYNHPYSSGLDDSPLWDEGMPVESPDLNTYLCVQMGSLAMMAEALGMDAEAAMWRRRAAAMVRRMIEDFWDEQAGLFRATHNHQPIQVATPFNLYPLWTGQLPDSIRQRVLTQLTDPATFWGEHVLTTVARNDPKFEPGTMWRGPVWANINYIFVEALHQIGENALADTLSQKTLELIMAHPGVYEYYDAETGAPPKTAAGTFGWTAAVFIDLALQATRAAMLEGPQPKEAR